ncbi:MAG: hypothetical protein AB8G05_24275 [Oligoflexales bacterium]
MRNILVLILLSLGNATVSFHHALGCKKNTSGENIDGLYYSFYKEDNPNFERELRKNIHSSNQKPLKKLYQNQEDQYQVNITNTYFSGSKQYDHVYFERNAHSSAKVDIQMEYTYYTRRCAKRVYGPSPAQSHCVKWLNEPHKGITSYHLNFPSEEDTSQWNQVHLLIRHNSKWHKKPKIENIAIVSHDSSYHIKKKRFRKRILITRDF